MAEGKKTVPIKPGGVKKKLRIVRPAQNLRIHFDQKELDTLSRWEGDDWAMEFKLTAYLLLELREFCAQVAVNSSIDFAAEAVLNWFKQYQRYLDKCRLFRQAFEPLVWFNAAQRLVIACTHVTKDEGPLVAELMNVDQEMKNQRGPPKTPTPGPVAVPPSPPPANPVAPAKGGVMPAPPKAWPLIRKSVLKAKVGVNENDLVCIEWCKKENEQYYQEDRTNKRNPHSIKAYQRAVAYYLGISELASFEPHIVGCAYSGDREMAVWDWLYRVTESCTDVPKILYFYGEFTAHDTLQKRRAEASSYDELIQKSEVIIMLDVYAFGTFESTPEGLKAFLRGKDAVLILQRFWGVFGHNNGAAWIRDPDNIHTIVATPEAQGVKWPAHDALDWLHHQGSRSGISWAIAQSRFDFDIIIVRNQATIENFDNTPCGCQEISLPTKWIELKAALPDLINQHGFLDGIFGTKTAWVNGDQLSKLKEGILVKSMTQWTFRALNQKIGALLPDNDTVRALNPAWYLTHLDNLVAATWLYRSRQHADLMRQLRLGTSHASKEVSTSVRTMDVPEESMFYKILKLGMKAVIVLGLLYLSYKTGKMLYNNFMVNSLMNHYLPKLSISRMNLAGEFEFSQPAMFSGQWFKNLFQIILKRVVGTAIVFLISIVLMKDVVIGKPLFTMNIFGTWWSPLIEELVKCFPTGGIVIGLAEATQKKHPMYLVFHVLTSYLPWYIRIPLHYLFNSAAKVKKAVTKWSVYKQEVYEAPWAERTFELEDECSVTSFPKTEAEVPRQGECNVEKEPLLDETIELTTPLRQEDTVMGPPVIHFNPVNVPVYTPDVNDTITSAAVKYRILAVPPYVCDDAVMDIADKYLKKFLSQLPKYNPIVWEQYKTAWFENYPDAKKKLMINVEKLQIDGKQVRELSLVQSKKDESLVRPSGWFKVRAVIFIPEEIQYWMGPIVFGATKRLKKLNFRDPGMRIEVYDTVFHFYFASSFTPMELNEVYYLSMTTSDIYVLAAGDDNLILHQGFMWAGDFSMYDQAQNVRHWHFEKAWLMAFGVTETDADLMYNMWTMPYKVAYNRKVSTETCIVDHSKRPMRATGGPDTTFGNTVNTLTMLMMVLLTLWKKGATLSTLDSHAATDIFAQMGMKIKLQVGEIRKANFLKGYWVPGRQLGKPYSFVWVPFISRFIKMGKTLTDPRITFNEPDLEQAVRKFLYGLRRSYEPFLDMPVYGSYLKKFTAIKGRYDPRLYKDNLPYLVNWKVPFVYDLDREVVVSYLGYYYDLDPGDIALLDGQCTFLQPFQFLCNPVLHRIAAVDYE